MFRSKKIAKYIAPGRHVHLVGIGGVSMRPLGLVLKGMGMHVTGSDMSASSGTEELEKQGISVFIGHHAENIEGAECIIRTAAAHSVADDGERVLTSCHDGKTVLIVFSFCTDIGFSNTFHNGKPPFSKADQSPSRSARSCPQEASISPPSFLRTVVLIL